MNDIFKLIIDVFTSAKTNTQYYKAIESLQNLIRERPKIRADVEEVLRSIQFTREYKEDAQDDDGDEEEKNVDEYANDQIDEQSNIQDQFLDPFEFEKKSKFVIRDESPFTSHFNELYESRSISNETSENDNPYYFEQFVVDILLKRFMPYCFIWSSLTLRDPNYIMDRWTNGTVEKFINTRKKGGIKLEPAEYIINSQKSAIANYKSYLSLQEKNLLKTPKKINKSAPPKTPSKTPKKVQFEEKLEESKENAVSTWKKQERSEILPANHKKLAFSYQNSRQINIVDSKQSSSLVSSNPIDLDKAPDLTYDGKIFKFTNGVILEEANIKRLLSKNNDTLAWLDDNLIDALLFILVKNSKIKLNQVHIFESSKATQLFVENETEYNSKINFNDFKYIIGIYNKNSHWHLIFIDNTVKIFYLLDPYKAKPKQIKQNFDQWKKILSERNQLNTSDNWRSDTFAHQKQDDTHNCGVICLISLEEILLNQDELNIKKTPPLNFSIDSSHLYSYREKLYTYILDKCKKK